ncbi:hypothetical protein C0993_012830, partial [Termitomyces sp. T159_Od127]
PLLLLFSLPGPANVLHYKSSVKATHQRSQPWQDPGTLPTHSDLKSLIATDSSLIKSVPDACKWLKSKGWILAGDLYNHTRLVTILATAALTSKQLELKNAAITVAFLLETDITDHVSNTLAKAVTRKTVDRIAPLLPPLKVPPGHQLQKQHPPASPSFNMAYTKTATTSLHKT